MAGTEAHGFYRQGLRRMIGRDVREHRGASPLELFFDLTFVVAFVVIGQELASGIAGGHAASAVVGFAITAPSAMGV